MESQEIQQRRPLLLDRNLLIIFSITLVAMMGVSSITPALPPVTRAFGISAREAGWLIAAFTLPGVFLAPVIGVFADRHGRKRVIVPSLLLFSIAGGACAFATGYEQLLVLRLLQGVGGASLNTLNMTLVGDLYSGGRRATAMGYTNGIISASAAGYPLLGGLVALLGWRYVFAMPILGLPVALLVLMALRNPEPSRRDRLGPYLRRTLHMLVDRDLLLYFLTGFVFFVTLYGPLVTYLPFFLEDRFGYTPVEVGLVLGTNAAAGALASFQLGALTGRWRRKPILIVSLALVALPLAAIPFLHSIWPVIAAIVVAGGAMGAGLALVQLLIADRAPMEQRGAMMMLNGATFRIGQTVGPLAMAGMLAVGGMAAVFVGGGAFAAACLVVLWLGLTDSEKRSS